MYSRGERIRYQPQDCTLCGKVHKPVILDAEKYYQWIVRNVSIQDAFPEMSAEEREILISGTCPECWKELFDRCGDEELELGKDTKSKPMTEKEMRERQDKLNAALELQRVREEYKWDQRDLEQREKDLEALEKKEEEERIDALEDYYAEMEASERQEEIEGVHDDEWFQNQICRNPFDSSYISF